MANFKNQDVLSMGEQLTEKVAKYTGKDDILGASILTFPQYISATRLTMYISHIKQFNTLNNPEFPKIFGGYENKCGESSSSIYKADSDYEVYAKIDKFEDIPGHIYALFIYDPKRNFYDVIIKKHSEELTENYGFRYNNEKLDSLEVGDDINKGETLYKSTSYDEDNNYRFGLNARVGIMLAPGNIEDAYIFRKGFAEKMVSIKNDSIFFGVNDNDFLLNIYGDENHYQAFPDIGEEVKGRIVACKRRIINDQILYDMKRSNMMKIQPLNDKPLYTMGGVVVDIDIYSNKPIDEIPNTQYNAQVLKYLKNQKRYHEELLKVCEEIVSSGAEYSDDIGYIYGRMKQLADPNYVWKHNNDNEFSNFMIDIKVIRDVPINIGSKSTGRYGDKGVVSEIVDDDKMPFTEDGRPLDVIVNPLSCPNRLNPFQWMEISFNHSSNKIVEDLKKMDSNTERFKYLCKYLKYFNERGEMDQLIEYYKGLDSKGKKGFWEDIFTDGIFINYPPMWDSQPAIEKIEAIRKEFNIERDQLYIRKWGRVIPLMTKLIVGEKYMLKLKQTSEKNFSVRSTGYLSQKGVPEKSNKVRTNENLYSTTPIAVGRDEDNNLGIGVRPFILSKMHLFYRTSPLARRETSKMYTNDVLGQKKFVIKRGFNNRNVEILDAKFKSLGLEIKFPFEGLSLDFDDGKIHQYKWKGRVYLCTKTEMREILFESLLRRNFENKYPEYVGTDKYEARYKEFREVVEEKMKGKLVLNIKKD